MSYCPVGNPCDEISYEYTTRFHSTHAWALMADLRGKHCLWRSATETFPLSYWLWLFLLFESSVTTCKLSILTELLWSDNSLFIKIKAGIWTKCILLNNHFCNLVHSRQTLSHVTLVICKYDMISCLVSFTT